MPKWANSSTLISDMKIKSKLGIWFGFGVIVLIVLFEITFWFGTPPKTSNADTKTIDVNGQAIAYQVSGSGPALVLLHSGAWSGIEFRQMTDLLDDEYTVYTVDMPGFGLSDKPQVTYSLEYLTRQMHGFIEQFPEKHFHLIGASIGGSVAVQLAASYPERVKSLTLIDPFGFDQDINNTAIIAQVPVLAELVFYPNRLTFDYILDHGLLSTDSVTSDYRDDLFSMSQLPKAGRAKLSVLRSTITFRGVHPDVVNAMKNSALEVHQPTLVLWGENDTYAPVHQHEKVQEYIPQAQYQSLATAGHFAHMETPDDISKYIKNFLHGLKSQ